MRSLWAGVLALLQTARSVAASTGSGLREAAIMAGAYGLYSLVKGLFGGSLEEGRNNALWVIDSEKTLDIYVEPDLQHFFVSNSLGMPFWNALYVVSQVIVLPLTLFLVYRYRRGSYAFVRNMAVISWTAGVVWYALQPVAPPRLLASGFTDTVSQQTFFDLDSEFVRAFYNPVAAMPSLHVGHGAGGRVGPDQAHPVGLEPRPRLGLPGAGVGLDRRHGQPLPARHRGRPRGGAAGRRDLGLAGARPWDRDRGRTAGDLPTADGLADLTSGPWTAGVLRSTIGNETPRPVHAREPS